MIRNGRMPRITSPIGEVIRGILPFLIILLLVLGLITYWPALTMWLPDLVFGK
jgi:C4-dicarboxylate transporter DctM subunit